MIVPQKLDIHAQQTMTGFITQIGVLSTNHCLRGYPILPPSTSSVISRRPRQKEDIIIIVQAILIYRVPPFAIGINPARGVSNAAKFGSFART
jgi:hypothetical protein